jgi:hypothetical protein
MFFSFVNLKEEFSWLDASGRNFGGVPPPPRLSQNLENKAALPKVPFKILKAKLLEAKS